MVVARLLGQILEIAKIIRGKLRKSKRNYVYVLFYRFFDRFWRLQKIIYNKSRKNKQNNIYVLITRIFDIILKIAK